MFEQSLVELSSEVRTRKRWTTALSYSLEALAVAALLSFPLVHMEALSLNDSPKILPPTRYNPAHVRIVDVPIRRTTNARPAPINVIQQPSRIPTRIDRTPDPVTPAYAGPQDGVPTGAIPIDNNREQNRVLTEMLRSHPVFQTVPRAARPPRLSTQMESLLIRKVTPIYPALAKASHTQGQVVMRAVISRQGSIEQLLVVSGHPLLVNSAIDAVKQWRYRPYLLNGEAVEVETQITVNFTLDRP